MGAAAIDLNLLGSGCDRLRSYESRENYLETILILSQTGNPVRSIDVVNELSFTKASVSVAMKNLREEGLISVSEEGHIRLSEDGLKIAEMIYERHTLITDWLIQLGVDKETAVYDACKMEHAMSDESFTAIRAHILSGG